MGIEYFFSTLSNNKYYKSCYKKLKKLTNYEHVFIDFNSIIHNIYEKVIEKLNNQLIQEMHNNDKNNKNLINNIKKKILNKYLENIDNKYYKNLVKKIDKISQIIIFEILLFINKFISNLNNLKLVYIALDGTPSKGKMKEQMNRVYMGRFETEMKKIITESYKKLLVNANYSYKKKGCRNKS